MNAPANIGHNNPPDPIDEALAPYADIIAEAENWLDGEPIETEGQMNDVDALLKPLRTATSDLAKAKKSATAPLHDIWKKEVARWKPTEDDLDRIKKGLTALVAPVKTRLAAEKEAERQRKAAEARKAEEEARAKIAAAGEADIEAQREAAAAAEQAEIARAEASKAAKDKVGGMRTVHLFEVTDFSDLLRWMNNNARAELEAFAHGYAQKNHREKAMPGVRSWTEKQAY